MVAAFGKAGLKPGEYLWASRSRRRRDRVIIDRLTQMAYVYRGDKLVGVVDRLDRQAGPHHAARRMDDPREAAVLPLQEIRQCADAVDAADRRIWDRAPRRRDPRLSREPRLHPPADEVRREALRPDEDRHRRSSSKARRRGPRHGRARAATSPSAGCGRRCSELVPRVAVRHRVGSGAVVERRPRSPGSSPDGIVRHAVWVIPVRSGCGLPYCWRRQSSNSLWNCCSRSRQ